MRTAPTMTSAAARMPMVTLRPVVEVGESLMGDPLSQRQRRVSRSAFDRKRDSGRVCGDVGRVDRLRDRRRNAVLAGRGRAQLVAQDELAVRKVIEKEARERVG